MRLCVTGAGGRIGQAFMERASKQPEIRLRALRRHSQPSQLSSTIDWVEGDLSDPTTCDNLLRNQDTLVHLAWSGVPLASGSLATSLGDGLLPTLHLFDAARRRGGLRLVFPSSGGTVYSDHGQRRAHREDDLTLPISSYAIQKLAAEHYLQMLCAGGYLGARILRVATAYGWTADPSAQQGFIGIAIAAALAREPVRLVGNPDNVRDFVHRDDVAEALLLAATCPLDTGRTDVINIGSGVGTSVREVVALLERELGRPVPTRQEYWDAARGLPGHAVLDIARAKELLGWSPKITLHQGLQMGLCRSRIPAKEGLQTC